MLTLRAIASCRRTLVNPARFSLLTAVSRAEISSTSTVFGRWKSLPALTTPLHQQLQHRTFASKASADDQEPQQCIYVGSLASRMKAVKLFSLTTSLVGLAAQPVLLEHGMKWGGTGVAVLICSFAGFFTFVTPLLLHFITKKYVTEIHYNPLTEEYTATTISILLQKIKTKFRPSDVKVPDVPGMFTSFEVGKRALFVEPTLFEDTEHYVKIMGYDKPIDFKLDLKETAPNAAAEANKQK